MFLGGVSCLTLFLTLVFPLKLLQAVFPLWRNLDRGLSGSSEGGNQVFLFLAKWWRAWQINHKKQATTMKHDVFEKIQCFHISLPLCGLFITAWSVWKSRDRMRKRGKMYDWGRCEIRVRAIVPEKQLLLGRLISSGKAPCGFSPCWSLILIPTYM